ncbi:MAG: hypothetical protein AAFZ11_07085 [Pseudomonadota bacterium]
MSGLLRLFGKRDAEPDLELVDIPEEPDGAHRVFIAEYNAMRTEIQTRIAIQKRMELIIISLVTVTLSGFEFIRENSELNQVLLFSSVLCSMFSIKYFEEDFNIVNAAKYAHQVLAPAGRQYSQNDDLFRWEEFRKRTLIDKRPGAIYGINRLILVFIATIIPLMMYVVLMVEDFGKYWVAHLGVVDWVFAGLSLLMVLFVIYVGGDIHLAYRKIAPEEGE